ncbi:ABC transporter substrate-binding protein [Ferrimonas lipolytica]|uniref:ABC transporter substrate-binding protein n=1 Tax=Ferrimonas lipolytica TaxID=2724191 RepID=A0A6H1UJ91_9GAMM|nr:ABC transporter substrate-binding protein [Ferrimonas lipolytica]QIZ78680.1 ABC transporter substrate-binding protein [Ferrimonas lipolytica]
MFQRIITIVAIWCLSFAALATPVQLTDMAGRHVTLPAPAKRVVTTYMPATIFCLSLGLNQQLVGISSQDGRQSLVSTLLNGNNPVAVGSRSAGINIETIISLQPDLVVINDKKDGARLAQQLSLLGVPTLLMKAESAAEVQQALNMLGTATGTMPQALAIQTATKQLQAEISQRLANTKPVPAYYANGSDFYRSVSGQMYQNELMQIAGLTNVAAATSGFHPKINLEQLLRWQPQFLVLEQGRNNTLEQQLAEPGLNWLAQHPRATLPSDALWHMPSPMAVAGAYYLASVVHPQQFQDVDVNERIAQFYQQILARPCASPFESSQCQ